MAEIVITALFAIGMWGAIWLLTRPRRRAERPIQPGEMSATERRRLYKRLGIDPAVMARQRPYGGSVMRPRHDEPARRSTRA